MKKPALDPSNRIAAARKAKGLTQQDLAEKVGVHWITISKLERGLIRLSPRWSEVLEEALGVSADDLLPANRELTSVDIVGKITASGAVERDEGNREVAVITNDLFHTSSRSWFVVEGKSLSPMFDNGDLLCFEWAVDGPDPVLTNRFSMVFGTIGDQAVSLLGYVRPSPYPGKFYVAGLSGETMLVDVETVVPLVMAIYDRKLADEESEKNA